MRLLGFLRRNRAPWLLSEVRAQQLEAEEAFRRFERALARQLDAYGQARWGEAPRGIRTEFPSSRGDVPSEAARRRWQEYTVRRISWRTRFGQVLAEAERAAHSGDLTRAALLWAGVKSGSETALAEMAADEYPSSPGSAHRLPRDS